MSYRGIDNPRNQLTRPKGRGGMFNKHNDQLPPGGRARFVSGMPLPGQPYPPSVGFARAGTYPTIHSPDFQPVQYSTQVSATPVWSQSIPMSETYQISNQHTYPSQQPIYNADTSHIMAIQNTQYISQVQNQTEYDPLTNVCLCPKCGFPNTLAHLQLKQLSDENKRLHERLSAVERQQNANYEENVRSSPASQATVSSLSADARPFHMGATQGPKTQQGTNVNTETTAERLHNPNGNDYSHRSTRSWQPQGDTPVVSASDVTNDQFNESTTSDPEWNSDYSHRDGVPSDTSGLPEAENTAVTETLSVGANEEWDLNENTQQDSDVVHTPSGTSPDKREEESPLDEKHMSSTPHSDGYGPVKNDRNSMDTPKSRPKEQRSKQHRHKGSKNEVHDGNRENESRRPLNRRGSGGFRPPSPQDQKDKRTEAAFSSRDSSQGRLRSGPDYTDRKESPSRDAAKTFDSADRNQPEKRLDSGDRDRTFSHGRVDSGDRYVRRGGSNPRRFNDQSGRVKGSEESNWRQPREQDMPRPAGRGAHNAPRRNTSGNFKVVTEKDGDLFSCSDDHSLAHCVAEDLRMGSGIAVRFRQLFKNVEELCDQKKRVGQVAFLEEKSRFIFYLITKDRSNSKPQWGHFAGAVEELKKLCVEKGVKNLAMPRIGCGLDRLDWRDVRKLLETTFSDSSVAVTVYNFQQNEEADSPAGKVKSSLYIVHEQKNLADIDPDTGLVFLCTEEFGTMDRTVQCLDEKHKILNDLRNSKKSVGDVVVIKKGREYLYGLVVKKTDRDPFSYVNFGRCLRKLRNTNSKDQYRFFGMEAFRDEGDPLTMEKIITSIRNVLGGVSYKLEFYICWPKDYEKDHVWEDYTSPNTTPSSK